jgi:1-acyl-sn-glycerol-3-phosphate acyltransferase
MVSPDPAADPTPRPSSPEVPDPGSQDYDTLLAEARTLYPGVRIGRPGRARTYWATITAMRVLRLRWAVRTEGTDRVAPGPAILIGNHVNALDPACVVIATWWRCSAFTKIEMFEHRGSLFFRLMGQIPLRRGDAASTDWAMRMSRHALGSSGGVGRIAIYPEGTRSPDPRVLHKLHKRIMIPLLQANPDVPVHVVTMQYENRPFPRRIRATARVSGPLPLAPRTMTPHEMTTIVRDAMLALGGQSYVDTYAQEVKAALRAEGRPPAGTDGDNHPG